MIPALMITRLVLFAVLLGWAGGYLVAYECAPGSCRSAQGCHPEGWTKPLRDSQSGRPVILDGSWICEQAHQTTSYGIGGITGKSAWDENRTAQGAISHDRDIARLTGYHDQDTMGSLKGLRHGPAWIRHREGGFAMTSPPGGDVPEPHDASMPPTDPNQVVSDGAVARAIIARRRGASSAAPEPEHLTDAQLLASIAAGDARMTVDSPMVAWSSSLLAVASCTESQLMASLSISRFDAYRLRLAFALHRRLLSRAVPKQPVLRQPEDVAVAMLPLVQIDHERLWCLPLNAASRLIGQPIEVTRGDVDGTDAGPRAMCRAALRAGAVAMIAAHNHPSGGVAASPADVAITRRLLMAGRTVDVPLRDHVICTSDGRCVSMRRTCPDLAW